MEGCAQAVLLTCRPPGSPQLMLMWHRTTPAPPCSSYLLTLVPATGTSLTMTYWPATTDESKANDLAGVSKASATCN